MDSYIPEFRIALESIIAGLFVQTTIQTDSHQTPSIRRYTGNEIFAHLIKEIRSPDHPLNPLVTYRQKERRAYRRRRSELLRSLCPAPADRDTFLQSMPAIRLPRKTKEVPYRYTWIAESPEAATVWGTHFAQWKKADKRTSTKATIFVPNNEWKYIVREGEDIIIRDGSTDKIVLMVIRNWCSDGDVLEWVSKIVNTAVGKKKSVRLDDPGKIVMMGCTSRARSSPTLGWAKNLLSKKTVDFTTPEELKKFDYQTSSTYALL
jgi:hypothetical protein